MNERGVDKSTTVIPKEDLEAAVSNNTVRGVLSRVYKFFMVSFGKDRTPVWNRLMDSYVNNPNNNVPSDRAKQTSAKGNMKREYLGPNLTFGKFCEAMHFAEFSKLEIIFIATDKDGKRMKMCEEINFDKIPDSEFMEDIIDKRVQRVGEDPIFDAIDGNDARSAIRNTPKKSYTSKGHDWMSKPQADVNSIIENNIVKPKYDDPPF